MFQRLFKRRLNIGTVLLINSVGITVFSLLLIGYLWISQERQRFIEEADTLRFEYIFSQKMLLKTEVERAIRYIRFHRDEIEFRLKKSLKNRVYEGYSIASSIWDVNKGKKSDAEIIEMIRDALSAIRFNDGRGYYFATQVDGIVKILADRPGEVGKNYWNSRDSNGKYFAREMSRIATEEKEGYVNYTMSKPGAVGDDYRKMAFVKRFEPYNWYIGAGEYLDDFEATVKDDVLRLIRSTVYGRGGYIFAGTWDGVALSGPAAGKNMINITDANGVKIVQELIRVSQEGGGYVTYVMPKLEGKKHAPKLSYADGVYKWKWYVGAGVYIGEIDEVIAEKRLFLEKQIREKIFSIIGILVSCLIIIFFIIRFISNRIRRNMQSLTDFFETSSTKFVPIDIKKLHFPEFLELAESANRMVDEKNRASEALIESEGQLRGILDSVQIGIVIIDPENFEIVSINPYAEKMINLPQKEILGQKCNQFICPQHVDQCPAKTSEIKDHILDKCVVNAAGQEIPILKSFAKIYLNGKEHFLESFIDITDVKAREREIQDLRNYLKNIIDSMPSAIIAVDSKGRIAQCNVETETIIGVPSVDATGMPWKELLSALQVELNLIDAAITERKPFQAENVKLLQRDVLKYLDISVYPLVTHVKGGAVIRIDEVTERVKLSELLIQTEKMMSVGGLAAGMAHEINNPLAAIIQSVQVLERRLKLDSSALGDIANQSGITAENIHSLLEKQKVYKMIAAIKESGFRAAKIVSNMLSFSKKSEYDVSVHNIADLMDKTIDLATNDYDLKKQFDFKKIKIQRHYEDPSPEFLCEAGQIQQVFLNILKNGAHAMMETAHARSPQFDLYIKSDEQSVYIQIVDNGPGMDDELKRRIFEPFFTTKKGNLGTGLGLSVSYFIITENLGGTIRVDSTPGKGSQFNLMFPIKPSDGSDI